MSEPRYIPRSGPTFDEAFEEFFGLCRVTSDDQAIVCGYPRGRRAWLHNEATYRKPVAGKRNRRRGWRRGK